MAMPERALSSSSSSWLHPRVVGCSPSERWGHSACFSHGSLYVFGGCCGGLHFSDVLALDLKRMTWSSLVTAGQQPGTRDSHTAVLVGHKMVVFGGINGSKKTNDLHILDLETRSWLRPEVEGCAPAPRESHSATLIGNNKLVVFGGSGEGEGNYLNDLHILDMNSMTWISPEVKGDYLPAPRSSHTTVAVNNRLIVYGGDCGDHYVGDVDIFDLHSFSWSKMEPTSPIPGVRAGHSSVVLNNKVYVIGGVGDRVYYNDVWILDIMACTWEKLEISGLQPQGRFSHSAVLADSNIVIYGGCGEDEHPLNEIVILLLRLDCSNAGVLLKTSATPYSMEHRRLSGFRRVSREFMGTNRRIDGTETAIKPPEKVTAIAEHMWKDGFKENIRNFSEEETSNPPTINMDHNVAKKRKTPLRRKMDMEIEHDEHCRSLSQQSSPSRSEQEPLFAQQKRSKSSNSHPTQVTRQFPVIFQQQLLDCDTHQKLQIHPFLHQLPHQSHHANIGRPQACPEIQQPQQLQQKAENQLGSSLQLKMQVPSYLNSISVLENSQAVQGPQVHFSDRGRAQNISDNNCRTGYCRQVEGSSLNDKQQRTAVTGMVVVPNLIGADVRGTVDAVFDSGYLMTAQVNGQIFRGVLFSPGSVGMNMRETNTIHSCSGLVNGGNHGNPGIVLAPSPGNVQAVQDPSCYNGSVVNGAPALSSVQHAGGPMVHSANWNGMESSFAPPQHGMLLKFPAGGSAAVQEMSHQLLASNNGSATKSVGSAATAGTQNSVRMPVGKADGENCGLPNPPQPPPQMFLGPGCAATGLGHWVWHPSHASLPLDPTHLSQRDTLHFMAVPPFSSYNITCALKQREMQASSSSMVGSITDPHVGVTLSLGHSPMQQNSNTSKQQ